MNQTILSLKGKYAITGGIGSGKSYVAKCLQAQGIEVFDCDAEAKKLMLYSKTLRAKLKAAIGEDAYYEDGSLNKAYISHFLLASEDNAKIINGIVHPAVAEAFMQSGKQWMECAILFESGFDKLVDKVVCVIAPLETRIQRVMKRDNISREQALEWIAKQLPQEEIARRSHYQIINDDSHNINEQIKNLLKI